MRSFFLIASATFSPPNINISMDNGSLQVTVNFPRLPSKICSDYDEEEEMACPINEFKKLLATVTLYDKQNLSDRQTRTGEVMREGTHKVEFGFLLPGRVYCAVANFTAEGVLASSPASLPQCVYIPANTESLIAIAMIVSAVLIALGLMIFLLWRHCASSERPLPRSLALLRDLELQKETFIDSYKEAPHDESFEGDHVSVVSICDFTLTNNQSSYQNNEYYTSHVLHDPDCIEYYTSPVLRDPDCIEGSVESGDLGVEVQTHKFHSFPSHPFLEANVQGEETPNIPLSSVQVKYTQQDEMSTEDPELYGDVEMFKTEYETNKHGSELIRTTDGCSQKTEYI
ncbi:hypothetical protein F2P79_014177 [Pimephales promelas]|nr:hypothetical protein F2P79_014177 [Pimephales promelas]